MAKTKQIAPARRKRKSQVSTEDSGEKPTEEQTGKDCLEEQVEEEAAVESTEIKEKDEDDIKLSTQVDEEGQGDHVVAASPSDQTTVQQSTGSGKRKVDSDNDGSESKKIKFINDGYCLYVGNLNRSKSAEEITDSLTKYLVKQSLLFQDVRLDRSRKHAYVDLASEMDLTKALGLNGEMLLDQPLKIGKAKVKTQEEVKKKKNQKKKAKNPRCLFLKNLPYTATKEDIKNFFNDDDVTVRFPGGAEGPSHGIAFVDFKSKSIAKKVQQEKQGSQFQGRDLIVDFAGEKANSEKANGEKANGEKANGEKANGEKPNVTKAETVKDKTKAPPPPSNILFVRNLSINVKQKQLCKIFPGAVSVNVPDKNGKSKGFAFVEFASVADAEKALQSTGKTKLCKRVMRLQFFEEREKPQKRKVDLKTLMVGGLSETTTAETLKSAFEGALSARIPTDKETNVSKKFGFVEFDSEDLCRAAKKAMEDCEIDNSKVTVSFARSKIEAGQTAVGGAVKSPSDKSADQGADKGKKKRSRPGGKRPRAALKKKKTKAKDVENKC